MLINFLVRNLKKYLICFLFAGLHLETFLVWESIWSLVFWNDIFLTFLPIKFLVRNVTKFLICAPHENSYVLQDWVFRLGAPIWDAKTFQQLFTSSTG